MTAIRGDNNNAIEIAVNDFLDNCNIRKTDSVFSVNIYIDNEEMLGLSISGTHENKIYLDIKDKIGESSLKFPSHYIERNNKLFYWSLNDSVHIITKEIVDVLSRYNKIDSTFVNDSKAYPEFVIDESIKGAHYYFCKNNLSIYKRVVTKTAMGWYNLPKLNCNTKK